MKKYECKKCHGLCDPGELEGGVCFECRAECVERARTRKAIDLILRDRTIQQSDGQMAMRA